MKCFRCFLLLDEISLLCSLFYCPVRRQYIRRTVVRREPARIRADSAGVRQQFAADFFSELFAKNFVRQKCFASTKSNY